MERNRLKETNGHAERHEEKQTKRDSWTQRETGVRPVYIECASKCIEPDAH